MFDNLGNMLGSSGNDLMGNIESELEGALGGGNTVLDPATDMRKTISDIIVAIVEIFSFLSNLLKI